MALKTLWLLAARGGSKGVPRKNLREIAGRSLLSRKVLGAQPAMAPGDRLLCSTEDHEIAQAALELGAHVLDRPKELATDEATSADVVWHAMKSERDYGVKYDAVMLLEPSSPFTKPEHYKEALARVEAGAAAAIGMRPVEPNTAFVADMRPDRCIADLAASVARMQRSRRQDFPVQWTASGGLYLGRWEMLERGRSYYSSYKTYGVLQDRASGHEIDTMEDLAYAEFLVEHGLV